MLGEQDEKFLTELMAKAKEKVKKDYNVEIKADIKIDKSRTLEENRKLIIEAVKNEKELMMAKLKATTTKSGSVKVTVKKNEEIKERVRIEEEKAKSLAEEINNSIICKNKDIIIHYSRLRKSIEMTAGGYFKSLFVHGRAGTGKSYQITSKLNEMGLTLDNNKNTNKDGSIAIGENKNRYIVFSGDMSLAFLYRFLYEHNGKVLIFRDLIKLISNLRTIDILKAVTETHGKRVVQKALYSREQEDLPHSFICESRFIFEMNSLNVNGFLKEDIEALLSRGDFVSVVFSFEEIAEIMGQIAKTGEEKDVTKCLIDNYKFVGWNNFNLRIQNKAFRVYEYCKDNNKEWRVELQEFLKSEMTETRRVLYTYMGEKAIRSVDLKRIVVRTHIESCYNLRTADRRIREWVLMRELFIVGFMSNEDEELESYLDSHRNYYLSLNPVEMIEIKQEKLSDLNANLKEVINQESKAVEGVV